MHFRLVRLVSVLEQGGKPVLFIFKIWSLAERKYSRIEQEALAGVLGHQSTA